VEKVLENIPQVTIEAQVLDRLRDAILQGFFPADSQLNQVHIAAQFGVSRGPVRVAINKLEQEGLVHNVPHRGTFVAPLDKKTVSDLYNLRSVLECYAVRLAVERCTHEDISKLSQLVKETRDAARQGNTNEVIRLDFQIHKFFMELSGNTFLIQMWSMMKSHVQRVLNFRHRSYPNLQEIADSHLPFIELMQNKNAEEAVRTMEAHICDALNDLMERWNTTDTQKGSAGHEVK
jgi:DNA-binding GntR family transcriptional regulator